MSDTKKDKSIAEDLEDLYEMIDESFDGQNCKHRVMAIIAVMCFTADSSDLIEMTDLKELNASCMKFILGACGSKLNGDDKIRVVMKIAELFGYPEIESVVSNLQ